MDRLRIEYAAEGFLSVMRRIHAGREDKADVEIRNLRDYSPQDRSALIAALQQALKMTSSETDKAFETWLINRNVKTSS